LQEKKPLVNHLKQGLGDQAEDSLYLIGESEGYFTSSLLVFTLLSLFSLLKTKLTVYPHASSGIAASPNRSHGLHQVALHRLAARMTPIDRLRRISRYQPGCAAEVGLVVPCS
jgi:hypothetical protein